MEVCLLDIQVVVQEEMQILETQLMAMVVLAVVLVDILVMAAMLGQAVLVAVAVEVERLMLILAPEELVVVA
jgi:hypothetical protein